MILVVDDEELVRNSVCEFLESIGYEVLGAPDAFYALEFAKDRSTAATLQAVVADINMPGLTGPEMWHAMKALVPRSCRVLFMSGRAHAAELTVELPGEILVKPFSLQTLEEKLTRLLGPQGES